MGIEGSLRRASLMNSEIRDHIAQCSVCNIFKLEQCQEELKPHELPGPNLAQTCLRLIVKIIILWLLSTTILTLPS